MSISSTKFAKIFIGTTAAIDRTTDELALSSYEGDTWKEIKNVEGIGEFGDEAAAIEVSHLGDARKKRLKGTRDAGVIELTCNRDPEDAGQVALLVARDSDYDHNFKVVLNDKPAGGTKASAIYFTGPVMSGRVGVTGVDEAIKLTAQIAINTDILEDTAE